MKQYVRPILEPFYKHTSFGEGGREGEGAGIIFHEVTKIHGKKVRQVICTYPPFGHAILWLAERLSTNHIKGRRTHTR